MGENVAPEGAYLGLAAEFSKKWAEKGIYISTQIIKGLSMQENFSKFRSRYILLDAVLVLFTIGILLGILAGVISVITGTRVETLTEDPIVVESISSLAVVAICYRIFCRLKKKDIQPKYLVGTISIKELPWLMLLIIFYGIISLQRGLSLLTIFLTHLISPSLAELAVKS